MRSCPACESSVDEGARFCPQCGASLTRACPSCGTEVDPSDRFCPSCGTSLGRPPEEERKVVTILFADVVGSTSLGERIDPERLRSILSTYFSGMSAAIEAWGGSVEKFIGDAIVAVFGVPMVREDDPVRALGAAREMLERLEDLNRTLRDRHGVAIAIRIGVNTGEVVATVGGGADQWTVAGDAVNLAARLEQTADPGTVLVGERTYLAARHAFRFDDPIELTVKGKAEPVRARRLLEPVAEAARGIPGLRAGMVGRDRELETLLGLLEQAVESGTPRVALAYGPAGIGKTRLVQEFVRVADSQHPGTAVFRGRCLAAGRGITFWPLGEILRAAAGISLDDPVELAAERLRTEIPTILEPLHLPDEEAERTMFALATTAGIAVPENPLDRLEPQEVGREQARAWPLFLTAHASRGPAIFIVEDLHWATEDLLSMLDRMVSRASGPVVVAGTARPEFVEAHADFATGHEGTTSISLAPLTGEQSRELVEQLLAEADLPSDLRDRILTTAEGNPFFLEEIVRGLIDAEVLVREGERWRARRDVPAVPIPDTVQGVLAARIDTLPPGSKRVLQEAAVIGRVFWEEPVARAVRDGDVANHLVEIERRGLILARPASSLAGQAEYLFKHALTRDVAYASLPKARRARAHAGAAAWTEEIAGDRRDEFAELIAYHYASAVTGEEADLAWAEDPEAREQTREKAFEALVAAGALARRRFAHAKAVELHEQALGLASTEAERAQAFEQAGDDHRSAIHPDDAVAAYRRALDVVRTESPGSDAHFRLCVKFAMTIYWYGGFRSPPEPDEIEAIIQEGLAIGGDDLGRARLLTALGRVAMVWSMTGRPDPVPVAERIGYAEEAWAIAGRLQSAKLHGEAGDVLAELYIVQGSFARALDVARRRLEFVDRVESRAGRAETLFEVAEAIRDIEGAYEEAFELGWRSYELAKEVNPHQLMHATFSVLQSAFWLGRWNEVLPLAEEHLAVYPEESDAPCSAVQGGPIVGAAVLTHMGEAEKADHVVSVTGQHRHTSLFRSTEDVLLGILALARGNAEDARDRVGRHLDDANRGNQPDVAHVMLDALAALEDWDALGPLLERTRDLADEVPRLGPPRDRAEGLLRVATGDRNEGAALLQRAIDGFDRQGARFEAARTREALAAIGAEADARRLLEAAMATYEELGARPHVERVRSALSSRRGPG